MHAGIGIGFLEDRLAGPSAHPLLKANLPIVRRLLETLLPESDVAIKGPAKTRAELLQSVSGTAGQDLLDKLLGLLDTEIRLITPTGGDALSSYDSGSASRESKYQLSHDYLVPAIRDWLSAEQRSTRKGRIRIRLRELAQSWNAKPDPRRLPTFFEWLTIRLFTRPHEWSLSQRRMMLAAGSRIRRIALVGSCILLLLLGLGWEWNGRLQASAVRDRLLNFNTTELLPVLQDASKYQRWLNPLLAQDRENARNQEKALSELERRQLLHLSLAGMTSSDRDRDYVYDQLPQLHPDVLLVVAGMLQTVRSHACPALWKRFEAGLGANSPDALSFGAALAHLDVDNEAWGQQLPNLARRLAMERPTHVGQWISLYQPLGGKLAVELARMLQASQKYGPSEVTNICEAIAAFAAEDPATLVAATQSAQHADLAPLIAAMRRQPAASRTELRRKLIALNEASLTPEGPHAAPAVGLPSLASQIAKYSGFSDATCGLSLAIPLDELSAALKEFAAAGHRPVSLRPYTQDSKLYVAVSWLRDDARTEVRSALRSDEIAKVDSEMQTKGFRIRDLSWYRDSNDPTKKSWIALWSESADPKCEIRVYADVPLHEHEKHEREWPDIGFSIERFDIDATQAGEPKCAAIWVKQSSTQIASFAVNRYLSGFGDLSPGSLQTDLRVVPLAPDDPDRLSLWAKISTHSLDAEGSTTAKNAAYKWLLVAKYRSALGEYAEASRLLELHRSSLSKYALFHEYAAVLHARIRNIEAFGQDIEAYRQFKTSRAPGMLEFLELRRSLLQDDMPATDQKFKQLEAISSTAVQTQEQSETTELIARASALVATKYLATTSGSEKAPQEGSVDLANQWLQRTIDATRRVIADGHASGVDSLVLDVDFDGLRGHPKFQALLAELGMQSRLTAAYTANPNVESQQLFGLSATDHSRSAAALRKQGFIPHAFTVQPADASGGLQCCSVWHRPVVPVDRKVKLARARSNLILSLAQFGETDVLLDSLQSGGDRELQSQLAVLAASMVPAGVFVDALRSTGSSDKASMLLTALAGYPIDQLVPADREYLSSRLPELVTSAADAQMVSAALCCLKKWQLPTPAEAESQLQADRNWYRNSVGQLMIVIHPPDKFLMGSPKWEADRDDFELLHWARIAQPYSLGATELRESQFAEFMKDERFEQLTSSTAYSVPTSDEHEGEMPQIGVHWFHAAAFCQWLSEREKVPEAEWCYPGIWNSADKPFSPPDQYRRRTGYRLPTEMEWEWAARSGAGESRHCGDDTSVLVHYEWLVPHSQGRIHPIATLRPNRFGFFDMLGNVHEWCDDRQDTYHRPQNGYIRTDSPGKSQPSTTQDKFVIRGGSFKKAADEARAANRSYQWADFHNATLGFRIARTVPKSK